MTPERKAKLQALVNDMKDDVDLADTAELIARELLKEAVQVTDSPSIIAMSCYTAYRFAEMHLLSTLSSTENRTNYSELLGMFRRTLDAYEAEKFGGQQPVPTDPRKVN